MKSSYCCSQGSDIETLGLEAAGEYGAELLERHPVEETKLQDTQASSSAGKDSVSVKAVYFLVITLDYVISITILKYFFMCLCVQEYRKLQLNDSHQCEMSEKCTPLV